MKIAFVCGFAWKPKGTPRARAFPLAAELVKKGHEVAIFLAPYDNPDESGKKESREGVRIVNVRVGCVSSLRQVPVIAKRLCEAVEDYSPDVIHCFKPKGYAGAACSWFLLRGFHNLALDCDDWEGWGGWNDVKAYPWIVKEYIDRQEKWLIRRVKSVTAASRVLERRAVALRASPSGVFYIPNCGSSMKADVAFESECLPASAEAKARFGLPAAPVLFHAGHFDPADDILFYCRTVEGVARRFRATVVFVGEGPQLKDVKEFFASRGDIVTRFFPRMPYEEFLKLVAASDIAGFPYPDTQIHRAKCSARIVDYMSLGKAVVTTAIGQNMEYIVDGESGVLVPPGDEAKFVAALTRLLHDPELRVRIGQNAKKRIKEEFSWDAAPVANCLAAYRQFG